MGASKPEQRVRPARSRRAVCDSVHAEQLALREAVSDFLASPSILTFAHVRRTGQRYVDFERDVLVPAAFAADLAPSDVSELRSNSGAVVRALHTFLWDVPGTARQHYDAQRLRRALLHQIEFCEQQIMPSLGLAVDGDLSIS